MVGQPVLPEGTQPALAFLIRSTSRRPISAAEAADKLRAREYAPPVVSAAVDRAVQMRILDDRAFADAWVNDRGVNRGYGRRRLEQELRRRQIPDPLVAQALTALDQLDERAQATELARVRAQRMPATLQPHKVAGRLVGFLVRRGFDSGLAHEVARAVTRTDRDWD